MDEPTLAKIGQFLYGVVDLDFQKMLRMSFYRNSQYSAKTLQSVHVSALLSNEIVALSTLPSLKEITVHLCCKFFM